MRSSSSVVAGLLFLCFVATALAGTSDHTYKKGEHVELWVNKVRPPKNE